MGQDASPAQRSLRQPQQEAEAPLRLQRPDSLPALRLLDGRIDTDLFDLKATEWCEEQRKCLALIHEHQDAKQTYFDEGIRLLELAQKAGSLFRQRSAAEKRRLLGFVLSNSTWKDGKLTAAYRQPFDLLAKSVIAIETKKRTKGVASNNLDIWLPIVDAYLTLCVAPTRQARTQFESMLGIVRDARRH